MLSCQRARFSLPPDLHYLNCAYMGPSPISVQEAGAAAIRRKGNPSEIVAADFFEGSEELRRLFGRLINADPARVAIIPAVSYGVAIVARNTPLRRGQNIVISGEQFPSNVYAWRRAAEKNGVELRVVPRAAGWNARLLAAIDDATAIVALPHTHWTDGTKFDLAKIGRAAHARGAAFVVDGTQSVGAMPFDVAEIQPDALLCAGYKWLLGPYGLGLAYFSPRYDNGEPLEDNWIARKGSDNFQRLVEYEDEYAPGAIRYDVGERSNFILAAMLAEALKVVLDFQPARIQEYCAALSAGPIEKARALGFVIEDADARGAHLFGLRTPRGVDLKQLNESLRARRVFASLRGSALRVSPHVYNDERDFEALLQVLQEVVR